MAKLRTERGTTFSVHGHEIRAALSDRLPKQPVRALDVGTGFGRNTVFLARQLAPGSHVWSVDPSEESLKRGAPAVQDAGLAAAVTLGPGSAERLPFRDEEYDLTVGVMLFHHLVEVPPALREMGRVTKPDGKLLIVDWGPTAHLLPFAIEHRVRISSRRGLSRRCFSRPASAPRSSSIPCGTLSRL